MRHGQFVETDRVDAYSALWFALHRPAPRRLPAETLVATPVAFLPEPKRPSAVPSNEDDLRELAARLPVAQRVIGAVTAAEMVAHLWWAWCNEQSEQPAAQEQSAPGPEFGIVADVLGLAYRWLDDSTAVTYDELEAAFNRAWDAGNSGRSPTDEAADFAIAAVANVAWVVQESQSNSTDAMLWAVKQAVNATVAHIAEPSRTEATARFLAHWWCRCQRRLAFFDAMTARLE